MQGYMYDILRTIHASQIYTKLIEINQMHPNLKYMIETELEGQLPFLDLCIIHAGNTLRSKWYMKPTGTGLIMNFHAQAWCSCMV